jgi:2-acylglycerol O-acyltransferase 2
MASVNAPLNANPALPEERAKQHLPSKSYADAVEEEAPKEISNGVNGTNGTNAANGTNRASTIGSNDVKGGHQASVLRIVDTGASPVEEKKEDKDIMEETRPQYERQESQHEYSATVCSLRSVLRCHY